MQPTGLGEDPSEYVVFPPCEEDLASFDAKGWTRFSEGGLPEVDLWTDDRTNTLSILQQSFIMRRNGVDVNLLGNVRNSLPFLKKKAAS